MNAVVLCGGVGGARLVHGLAELLAPDELTVVVNTGDDLVHWGLHVSPDLDTVMYTLSGLADAERGWGLRGETWQTLARMGAYGQPTWFQLGDRDLATHLVRTAALRDGVGLTDITRELFVANGVDHPVLPMSDDPIGTVIETRDGRTLPFQDWLVREGAPRVRAVRFEGVATPTPAVVDALGAADVVLVAPSNPYVSIDPILSLPGVRDRVRGAVAVSPIVGGRAIKGPLAQMIPDLAGREASAQAVAHHYGDLLAGMVVEHGDGFPGLPVFEAATVMRSRDDRVRLATLVLAFAESL